MEHVTWDFRPTLLDPVAFIAYSGWNDGGEAATGAIEHMIDVLGAEQVASIDHEDFADFQVTRPMIALEEDGSRHVTWPETSIFVASSLGQDVVLIIGEEPRLRWKKYCRVLAGVLKDLEVKRCVTFGAFLGQVAHTSEPPIIGLAAPEVKAAHALLSSSYEGPTGVVGILTSVLGDFDLDVTSLWAGTPHYLAGTDNPKASRALIAKSEQVFGLDLGAATLDEAVEEWEQRVEEAVLVSDDLQEYVERLQEVHTEIEGTGVRLVEEIEKFLRDDGPVE